jgi:hypothetical protein
LVGPGRGDRLGITRARPFRQVPTEWVGNDLRVVDLTPAARSVVHFDENLAPPNHDTRVIRDDRRERRSGFECRAGKLDRLEPANEVAVSGEQAGHTAEDTTA